MPVFNSVIREQKKAYFKSLKTRENQHSTYSEQKDFIKED